MNDRHGMIATLEDIDMTPLARQMARQSGIDAVALKSAGGRINKLALDKLLGREARPARFRTQAVSQGSLSAVVKTEALRNFLTRLYRIAPDISLVDLLVRGAALALAQAESGRQAHIAIAVAIDGGIAMPVLRNAERKGLAGIAREIGALSEKARTRTLSSQEQGDANLTLFYSDTQVLEAVAGASSPMILSAVVADDSTLNLILAYNARAADAAPNVFAALRGFLELPDTLLL